MTDANPTTPSLDSPVETPIKQDDESHSPIIKSSLTRLPHSRKPSTPAGRLITAGQMAAIEIVNEYSTVECDLYWRTTWTSFLDLLPSPDEVDIILSLVDLIRELWPAVKLDLFRLRLFKSSWEWENDESSDSDSDSDNDSHIDPEPERCCQARLGVYEETKTGEQVCEDILLGPRIRYQGKNGKKPEFEQERAAVEEMVSGLERFLGQLTPAAKRNLAEDTYAGSSSPGKKRKMGARVDDAIMIE